MSHLGKKDENCVAGRLTRRELVAAGAVLTTGAAMPLKPEPRRILAKRQIHHRNVAIDGLKIFYRETGPADGPVLLLLHGFPSSSRMWIPMMERLSDEFRLVAPDYPGFGHSDAPSPHGFAYTFDNIGRSIAGLVEALGIRRYTLVMQDYGGPVGFRLALATPARVQAMVVQNAVAHEQGLGPLWDTRKAFWADRPAHEAAVQANLLSLAANRQRHVGTSPNIDLYDPDWWTDETAFLARPGQVEIQTDLFYDYRTNVASYPSWQRWLRKHRPPLLVTWGVYDPSFVPPGALAYGSDVPDAEIHLLEAGHFPMDEAADQVSALTRRFLRERLG